MTSNAPKTVAVALSATANDAQVWVDDAGFPVGFDRGGAPQEVSADLAERLLERDDFKRATKKAAHEAAEQADTAEEGA